ncbi:hypothetical protein GL50803_002155 [Giardia duodenalis]|uniref:Uncharacterized protein n=1 Tax=Giardia intestinalis (strain ATCC 50803 / WB clone C6) TaxID=184922 RepID=A8BJQ6_GIAIC|nr:hypothetical protein GL50803_002155 [Giardia intestinalis]KAE8303938.1 hypothetical protein GL50803_002155 [Giardia intestinalis]|eukprot:XP_001706635.1 Hypothetical protein GL50803_2155 [Giardia lamblia ATCC 50803]
MSNTDKSSLSSDIDAWIGFAATGNDWELEQLRHLVGQQDTLGQTALMHYVRNGWYKRIYLFAGEVACRDVNGDDALAHAKRVHNEEAVHRIAILLKNAQKGKGH